MSYFRLGSDVDPALYGPIGEITVSFAVLEDRLESRIWYLLSGAPPIDYQLGQIVTAELSFGKKIDLFRALYLYRSPADDQHKLRSICQALSIAEQRRNQLVHSNWHEAGKPETGLRVKRTAKRKGLVTTEREHSAQELREFAQHIEELAFDLVLFLTIPEESDE